MVADYIPDETKPKQNQFGDLANHQSGSAQRKEHLLDQVYRPDNVTNNNFARRDGRVIQVAFRDEPKADPKGDDKAKEVSAVIGEITDDKRNAVGAYVKPDKYGPEFLERKDKTRIIPKWEPNADGKTARLAGFDQVSADRKQTISWVRDGDKFTSKGVDGKSNVLKDVEFDRSNNGNMTFKDERGQMLIVRGNGQEIPAGPGVPSFKFDADGRIERITPIPDEWNKGAPTMGFSYLPKSDKLQTVALQIKGQPLKTHEAKPGETLENNGDYKLRESINIAGKPFPVTRVHRPGTHPNKDDLQSDPIKQEDGSSSIAHFDLKGQFSGVEGFDNQNRLLKRFIFSPDHKQMVEMDARTGNTNLWTKTEGEKWRGKQVQENGKSVNKDIAGLRENLEFTSSAELTYKDDKGNLHRDLKDGKTEVEKINPEGNYSVVDEKGRLLRAGATINKDSKQEPDRNNYLAYKYGDKTSSKGEPLVIQVDRVRDGKKEAAWIDKGEQAALNLTNGEFAYIPKEGEKIILRPDLSTSKFIQVAKDAHPLSDSGRLSEIGYPDGSKRNFEYDESLNKNQPARIISSSVATNGDTTITILSAKPMQIKPEAEKPAAEKSAAIPEANREKARAKAKVEMLSTVQMWEMTAEKISADGKRRETLESNAAPYFALELTKRGDVEATSSGTDNNRYLFPVRGMAKYSKGIPVQLDGADGRVLTAQKRFDSAYAQYVLPEERKTMDQRLDIGGRLVDKDSIDINKDPKLVSVFARMYMTDKDKLNIPVSEAPRAADRGDFDPKDLAKIYSDIAYQYELAAAIIEGRELVKRRKSKAPA